MNYDPRAENLQGISRGMRDQAEVREEFIEKVGLFLQSDGVPRIAGRVFGLFLFDGETRSFGDLVAELQVSKASISTATRILEDRRLIKRVGRPGQRQDFFQLIENPYPDMLKTLAAGLQKTRAEIDASLSEIDPQNTGAAKRLAHYARFYGVMVAMLDAAAKDLAAKG
jgi:DNA-binding transcriptional regulator GbsR (MarR family)